MVSALIWAMTATVIISFISIIGLFVFSLKNAFLDKWVIYFVSFSAGSMLGDAFIHLLPQAVEEKGFSLQISISILGGVLVFFIVEKFVLWRHCHLTDEKHHKIHAFAYTNLFGEGIHNFIDGVIIAGAFLISTDAGIATTIAVAIHEIPQEIGDFAVLVHSGLSKMKAVAYNFLVALTAVIGAAATFFAESLFSNLSIIIISFAAGAFVYIAASDLIPELHKETQPFKSLMQLVFLVIGILIMIGLFLFE